MSAGVRFSVTQTSSDVVEPVVVAAERVAGVDAALAGRGDHLARGPSDAGRANSLNVVAIREHERQPEPLLRVRGEAHAGLPQLAQPLRAPAS